MVTRQFQGSDEEGGDTAEDQIRRFEEEIGLRHNPDDDAIAALREWQMSQGINPDAQKIDIEAEKPWWTKDTEL